MRELLLNSVDAAVWCKLRQSRSANPKVFVVMDVGFWESCCGEIRQEFPRYEYVPPLGEFICQRKVQGVPILLALGMRELIGRDFVVHDASKRDDLCRDVPKEVATHE